MLHYSSTRFIGRSKISAPLADFKGLHIFRKNMHTYPRVTIKATVTLWLTTMNVNGTRCVPSGPSAEIMHSHECITFLKKQSGLERDAYPETRLISRRRMLGQLNFHPLCFKVCLNQDRTYHGGRIGLRAGKNSQNWWVWCLNMDLKEPEKKLNKV